MLNWSWLRVAVVVALVCAVTFSAIGHWWRHHEAIAAYSEIYVGMPIPEARLILQRRGFGCSVSPFAGDFLQVGNHCFYCDAWNVYWLAGDKAGKEVVMKRLGFRSIQALAMFRRLHRADCE